MTDLIATRLDQIPELRDALAELASKRDQKIEQMLRPGHTLEEYIALAAEIRTLNDVCAAPYKPRQRNLNAA